MNSRNKGAVGEREAAKFLNEVLGTEFRRGQQFQGSPESPDITGAIPGLHFEVKRVEHLNLALASKQAERDSSTDQVPVVMHRRNRGPWYVTFPADQLVRVVDAIHEVLPSSEEVLDYLQEKKDESSLPQDEPR